VVCCRGLGRAAALKVARTRHSTVPTSTIPSAGLLALAGCGASCAFAPPLLLCVSALALGPIPHRSTCQDRVARCAGLRGGKPFPLRASRMEFQTVGSKRARMDSADAAQGGGDATVQGMTLALVPQEEALFELLMKVVEAKQLPCVLRVAGGWVRDKIMGKEAHDIDIAIDTMMGQDFTQHLVDYMKEAGRDQEVGSVGVIKRLLT
jgi:hypothetical protein